MLHATEILGAETYDAQGHFVGHVKELFIEPADQPSRVARMLLGRGKYRPLLARHDQVAFVAPGTIRLNVDEMPFVVAKPHQFGNVAPVDEARGTRINQAQIGSCANGRFEDIEIAARMLEGRKVAKGVRFLVSPASQQVYLRCLKAGLIEKLVEAGAQVITPGCGVCQPRVGFLSDGEVCITATTRNYKGRKGSPKAEIYLAGPLTVAAAAVAGEIVNPKEVFRGL